MAGRAAQEAAGGTRRPVEPRGFRALRGGERSVPAVTGTPRHAGREGRFASRKLSRSRLRSFSHSPRELGVWKKISCKGCS